MESARIRKVTKESWSDLEAELSRKFDKWDVPTDRMVAEAGDAWGNVQGWVIQFQSSNPSPARDEPAPSRREEPRRPPREVASSPPAVRPSSEPEVERPVPVREPSEIVEVPVGRPPDPPAEPVVAAERETPPPPPAEPTTEEVIEELPPDLAEALRSYQEGMEHYANSSSENPNWQEEVTAAAEDLRVARAHLRRFREEHPERCEETDPLMQEINRYLYSAIKRSPPRH